MENRTLWFPPKKGHGEVYYKLHVTGKCAVWHERAVQVGVLCDTKEQCRQACRATLKSSASNNQGLTRCSLIFKLEILQMSPLWGLRNLGRVN